MIGAILGDMIGSPYEFIKDEMVEVVERFEDNFEVYYD